MSFARRQNGGWGYEQQRGNYSTSAKPVMEYDKSKSKILYYFTDYTSNDIKVERLDYQGGYGTYGRQYSETVKSAGGLTYDVLDVAYNPDQQKNGVLYYAKYGTNQSYVGMITLECTQSSGSSWSTATNDTTSLFTMDNSSSYSYVAVQNGSNLRYDEVDDKFYYGFVDRGDSNKFKVATITATSGNYTATETEHYTPANGIMEHAWPPVYYKQSATDAYGGFHVIYRQGTNGYIHYYSGKMVTSSNLTGNTFLGVSNSAATAGQPVIVTISGGINTSVTGLTINEEYKTGVTGVIGTTGTVDLGRALDTNKLWMNAGSSSGGGGGGGGLTLVADGAITEGDPVSVTSDGKAARTLKGTNATITKTALQTPDGTNSNSSSYVGETHYGRHSGKWYQTWLDNSNHCHVACGTDDGAGNITWGTPLSWGSSSGFPAICEVKNYNGDPTLMLFHGYSSHFYLRAISVSGTVLSEEYGSNFFSSGWDPTGQGVTQIIECVDSTTGGKSGPNSEYDQFICMSDYNQAWSAGYKKVCAGRMVSTGNSGYQWNKDSEYTSFGNWGWTTRTDWSYRWSSGIVWNPDEQACLIYGFNTGSGAAHIRGNYIYFTNNSNSLDHYVYQVNITPDNNTVAMSIVYDSAKKIFCGVRKHSGDDRWQAVNFKRNGGSWTTNWSDITPSSGSFASSWRLLTLYYSPAAQKTYMFMGQQTSNQNEPIHFGELNFIDGGANTLVSPNGQWTKGTTVANEFAVAPSEFYGDIGFSRTVGVHPTTGLALLNWGSSPSNYYTKSRCVGFTAYDRTGTFIGAATSTVADGANVTITALGETNTKQSGLTAGSPVYVSSANATFTHTATGNTEIGVALSATDLYIKSSHGH